MPCLVGLPMRSYVWIGVSLALAACGWYLWRRRRVRRGREAFHRDLLHSMLGAGCTTDTGVRLWGRAPEAGVLRVQLLLTPLGGSTRRFEFELRAPAETDQTFVIDFPEDVEGAPELTPGTTYDCELRTRSGETIGRAQFETAPAGLGETPKKFAVGCMSCHLPFDDDGFRRAEADHLLELVPEVLERYGVKRVVMMGDQVYGDLPEACSLFDNDYFRQVAPPGRRELLECSREEVRGLYQRRHRIFWASRAMQAIQRRFACHMILDDHEVFDNFGSSPEHGSERYHNLIEGAKDAFFDYQASRVLGRREQRPVSCHHQFDFGTLSVFVMDLRSNRKATEETLELFDAKQLKELETYLRARRHAHVVAIVLSVPLAHVPDWMATLGSKVMSMDGDAEDRWSSPRGMGCRDRLLRVLRAHQAACPTQRLVVLGGDVHVGAAAKLDWGNGIRPSYELIASALSNSVGFPMKVLMDLAQGQPAVTVNQQGACVEMKLLEPTPDAAETERSNPYGGLNVGVLEIERLSETESTVRLILIGCADGDPPEPKVVFDSGRL